MLCPYRISKSITIRIGLEYGREVKRVSVKEDYPICLQKCPFYNDKHDTCRRASTEINKGLSVLKIDDKQGVTIL